MRSFDMLTDKILRHGLGVASARGLQAVSMGDVARELEVSRSGLVAKFGDKDNLQLAILNQAADLFIREVVQTGPSDLSGDAQITRLFENWIAWGRSPRLKHGCPFVRASADSEGLATHVRDKLNEVLANWAALLATAINEAKQLGHLGRTWTVSSWYSSSMACTSAITFGTGR